MRRRAVFGVCAAALVALAAVVRDARDENTAGVLVSVIAAVVSVAAFLGDALRDNADVPRPAVEVRRRAAGARDEAVREQWAAEARLRRLQDPELLDVRWAPPTGCSRTVRRTSARPLGTAGAGSTPWWRRSWRCPAGAGGTVAYAANMRSVPPGEVRAWLTRGPALGAAARCLPAIFASGLLVGLVGGCVRGVHRALSAPSDVLRAAGPHSTLRTDRTASLARGGIAALLTAVVCLPVVLLSHDGGGLATAGAQLWIPVGATALALGAWGRFLVTRVRLAVTGRAPWRLMGFLDEAHRRGALRQSGAYCEFRHRRLRRRLAGVGRPAGGPSAQECLDVLG
ncbi:hypothetical protein [Streptomyces sp. NPDC097610]|uniref:hypothetical protein n=1 Tax=Streptomyces sp. NPDC097610 TaxID=3157227 RepID=UPI00331C6AB3